MPPADTGTSEFAEKNRQLFLDRLAELVPANRMQAVLSHLEAPERISFRLISQGTSPLELEGFPKPLRVEPIAGFPDWYSIPREQRDLLTNAPIALGNQIYIQNLSSLFPVLALDPRPGEEVLDLAAAPGGKTLLLAARMEGQGRIAAVEAVKPRFFRLRANLERFGVGFVDTYLKDGRTVGRKVPGRFDRVLLDAPCSSEARIRINDPQTWQHWSPRKVKEMQRKQKGLLASALEAVRPGGIVVYSTCSFAPEENELVIQHLLQKWEGRVEIEPVELGVEGALRGLTQWKKKALNPSLQQAVRIVPDGLLDGFFVCRLRRTR